MKILMVTMSMNIGGAETHIFELSRELALRGHSVTLVSNGGVYADMLDECGVRCVTLPLHKKDPSSVVKAYMGLKKLILSEDFDVVHAHARIPGFIIGLLNDTVTKNGRKFRFVTTAHLNFSVNPLLRRISRWGERVMAVSDDIADYLMTEYSYPGERIYKTINGIDTDKFSPDTDFTPVLDKYSLDKSHKRVVYVSRLDPDRSEPAYRLLDIAQQLNDFDSSTDIIIVGGGQNYDELKDRADNINKKLGRNMVTMTGAVSNVELYCAAADVFIGVSRAALEAMSASRPVIVAGGQGAIGIFDSSKEEIAVETNFCCRGCEPESAEKLLEDIKTLLENEKLRKSQGDYNRSFIKKHYTASRMADDYLEMYNDTVSSPIRFKGGADVVVSGYYGFGNLGDESLLDVISASVSEEKPDVKIAALTKNPKKDSVRTGLKCVSRFNIPSVIFEIARARVLVSGGGSLLQDKTSKRSLRYYALIMRLAAMLHKKVYVYANGIGPICTESNKKLAARVVSKADVVSVRDSNSKKELVSLGVDESRVIVSADPVFLISPGAKAVRSAEKITDSLAKGQKFFVVSVRPLDVATPQAPLTEDDCVIVSEIAKAAADISKKYSMTPILLPMQTSRDTSASEKLQCELLAYGINAPLYSTESAGELYCVLEKASLVIGMRLHAVIFASSAKTPVIGLSYDPKVKAFMHYLGQDFTVDLEEGKGEFSTEITDYADAIMSRRDEVAAEISCVTKELREKAHGDTKRLAELLNQGL